MVTVIDDMCDGKVSSSEVLSHVNASRLLLLDAYPMFYPLLLLVKVVVDEKEKHLMSVSDDGTVFVSPRVINYSLEEVGWVLLHELLHLFYNHFVRGKNFVSEIWELATELEINDFLPNPPLKRPFGVLLPEEVGLPSGKTAEWYYHQLSSNHKLKSRVERRMRELFKPCGGVKKDKGEKGTTDNLVFDLTVEEVLSSLSQRKDIGNLPKTVSSIVVKGQRQLSLTQYFSELEWFVRSVVTHQYRWKFSLPSRRFQGEVKPPRVVPTDITIGVILDVSSSMTSRELSLSLQTIRGIVRSFHGEVKVFAANVDIVKEITDDEVVPTGGGTSMKQSIISLTQNDHYQGIIVFTDGYTDYPQPEEVDFTPILWVLTEPNPKFQPSWGKLIHLPEKGENEN